MSTKKKGKCYNIDENKQRKCYLHEGCVLQPSPCLPCDVAIGTYVYTRTHKIRDHDP